MTISTRDQHLFGDGPKKVLALDGGGARGIVTLAFLAEAERLLKEKSDRPDEFRLCEHYDLIGGTSAGATIAAGLAAGFTVAELIDIYLDLSRKAFDGSRWHGGILAPKFKGENVQEVLRRRLGHITLGSDRLKTGLVIVAKRIDTGSPWVFHNNPKSKYFDPLT